ncbi:uncharacterized protein LOC121760424 [Salvia splendens]|uniref:uncharacterized protein LOC121760424 n=1 Tax=Salvia splendens TaxID=180675 RepID=UPI001C26CF42|nr:uncharacterized protein LOC121760424 [Salvia splendens]
MKQLEIYKAAAGLFASDIAKEQINEMPPADWWSLHGASAPLLQKFALKVLSLTCSASGCERNWSVFEQIHSKKRNRLEHQKMHDLVYVKYNQKLNERYDKRHTLDPISLDYIDHCNEWLVGELDGANGEGSDRVFDGDSLDWDTVYESSGIGEPITYTRSKKRKEASTSSSSRKASSTTTTSRKGKGQLGKGRLATVIEERELVDEELEDEEVGDEEEGSTSLEDDDIDEDEDNYLVEDDYVGDGDD